jgi:hypothetical protein
MNPKPKPEKPVLNVLLIVRHCRQGKLPVWNGFAHTYQCKSYHLSGRHIL